MIYVFDTNAFITLFRNFYLLRFPSLWQKFENYIGTGKIISVKEVYNEIESYESRLGNWVKENKTLFPIPSKEEFQFVSEIFAVKHFQDLIRKKQRLEGKPVADPFVIAKSKIIGGCVVTEELGKQNSVSIPNVCKHFNIECLMLEGFMEKEDWTF